MDKKRRFVSTTDEEIEQKRVKMNAQKNNKQNIATATLLREYLKEKHLDTAFEHYNPQQLDECLAHFFMNVRKSDGLRYKTTSLSCLRYSLSRYLKARPYITQKLTLLRTQVLQIQQKILRQLLQSST